MRQRRFLWTDAHTRRLREAAKQGRTAGELAAEFGCATSVVRTRAQRHGVKLKRAIGKPFGWTPEREAELARRYETQSAAEIAEAMGCTVGAVYNRAWSLGLKKTSEWARECTRRRWADGRHKNSLAGLEKGRGWNKGLPQSEWIRDPSKVAATQFKPGEMPYNWVPIGSYRVTTAGDVEQKVADDRTPGKSRRNWRPVRVLVWEAEHGPVPKGHVVRFRDGCATTDPDAIKVEHLECISRAENMRRNSFWENLPPDAARLVQLRGALNRRINNLEREKNERS